MEVQHTKAAVQVLTAVNHAALSLVLPPDPSSAPTLPLAPALATADWDHGPCLYFEPPAIDVWSTDEYWNIYLQSLARTRLWTGTGGVHLLVRLWFTICTTKEEEQMLMFKAQINLRLDYLFGLE